MTNVTAIADIVAKIKLVERRVSANLDARAGADAVLAMLAASDAHAISAEPTTAWQPTSNSVQSSSLLMVRLHRLDFYVVLRKLIPKLQAFSKCIQETSMV